LSMQVRRSAARALAHILAQQHLSMPESTAVPAATSTARVGLSLGPGSQGLPIGWNRASREGDMLAALDALCADGMRAVASEARAVRARFGAGGGEGEGVRDVLWSTVGKGGCYGWGHDAAGVGAGSAGCSAALQVSSRLKLSMGTQRECLLETPVLTFTHPLCRRAPTGRPLPAWATSPSSPRAHRLRVPPLRASSHTHITPQPPGTLRRFHPPLSLLVLLMPRARSAMWCM
jgi:hypothetical protein